ncbi:hypothetical protein IWQ62_000946, partial [Dispira parvispora]
NENCPLSDRAGIPCPNLCVTDLGECPDSLAPEQCDPGFEYCYDGTCRETCDGVENICMCGLSVGEVGRMLYPCAPLSLNITVPRYDPQNKEPLIAHYCAAELGLVDRENLDDTIPYWQPNDTASQIWLQCPEPPIPVVHFDEPMFIVFYSLLGAQLTLLAFWYSVRTYAFSRVNQLSQPTANEGSATSFKPISTADKEESRFSFIDEDDSVAEENVLSLTVTGYRNSFTGLVVLLTVLLSTLGWLALLAVIVLDYYGLVQGSAYAVFANTQLSSRIFVVVWHLAAVWFVVLNMSESRFRNFFRLPSIAREAQYVAIAQSKEEVIVIQSPSRWLTRLREWENWLYRKVGQSVLITAAKVHQTPTGHRYFEYQCTRYVYQAGTESTGAFLPYEIKLGTTHKDLLALASGLTTTEAVNRAGLVGPNFIQVKAPSFFRALLEEFLAFFYIYQMMCQWVWYYFNYYYMGLVQTGTILLAAVIKVIIRVRSNNRIKLMAEYRSECQVKRDGHWATLPTEVLVPGDIVALEGNMQVPCDGVLLCGELVVNESSLTGEAMPVRKFPIGSDDTPYQKSGVSRANTLFDGTYVLQIMADSKSDNEKGTHGAAMVVTQTRTSTDKGKLIQKILFPTRYSFIFDEHLKLVVLILLFWGGICFLLIYWFLGNDISTWFYGVFTISFIISPLLPAMLVVGQSVAASRLRMKQIFCVDLPRIVLAGKVQVFCFDKTGTLTKEGLEFYGVQGVNPLPTTLTPPCSPTTPGDVPPPRYQPDQELRFSDRKTDLNQLDSLWQIGLASCHSVADVGDQYVGNPVDIELFRSTGWQISPSSDVRYLDTFVPPETSSPNSSLPTSVHVVKRFEFVHARASMSVAVLDPSTGHVHVFVKGSFEKIKENCRPWTIPSSYNSVTGRWAKEGCYVLAMGHRDLGKLTDLTTIQNMGRDDVEQDLSFLGLLLFKNNLKEDTAAAIHELREGSTRTVMITGDNALTGVYIARACEMVSPAVPIILGDVDTQGNLVWRDVDSELPVLDVEKRLVAPSTDLTSESTPLPELALTGKAFEQLVESGLIHSYLDHIRIFARMTPDGKVQCIQLHMQRYITAMCGDGGNDCGALRAAHVGLALSDSEASIVAPFSTNVRSIQSCVELLRQGRTALATSFANYKFVIMYGEIMVSLGVIVYYFSAVVPQAVWIFIDGFIMVPMCFSLTQAGTQPRLAPFRPTARLLGTQTIASAMGMTLINFAFMFGSIAMLFQQDWFQCHQFDSSDIDAGMWWLLGDNYESEIISLTVLFQFINAAAAFNFGYYFRTSWWRNYLLILLYFGYMCAIMILTLMDPNPFSCLFRINCGTPEALVELGYPSPTWDITPYNIAWGHNVLPPDYRWKLWGLCVANCIAALSYEYFVVLGPVGRFIKRKWGKSESKLTL